MMDFFGAQWASAWARLPEYLGEHIRITLVALAAGLSVSLPLALAALRRPWLRHPLLAAAGAIQTIPGIALLALFYPLLFGVATLTEAWFGWRFSALGFWPTVLALLLYSMLPVLRNTIAGIEGVDPAVVEAARGMGFAPRQVLLRVQLPLALPVILAGVRTATVWVVGIATLSTPVGQTSLGNYIFAGLQTQNWTDVLFGCVAAAVLAMVLDQLVAQADVAWRRRSLAHGLGVLVVVLAVLGAGLGGMRWQRQTAAQPTCVIGAKTFSEQFILAELIQQRVAAAGYAATVRQGLGSSVAFDALCNGDLDCYVDYSGTIWANYMKRAGIRPRAEMLAQVTQWLAQEHGVVCLGTLGFENAYGLAVRKSLAEKLHLRSIADLALHADALTIGGDYEFFGRPEWERLRTIYGLQFAARKQFQSTFMYRAAGDGEVDVISAFTSDGRIAAYELTVLTDPQQAILPYDAVLLLSPRAARETKLRQALTPLVERIDISAMQRANQLVDVDGQTPAAAARWLADQLHAK